MKLVKTTLRIEENLKKAAEREAIENDTTFQKVVNTALEERFEKNSKTSIGSIDPEIHRLTKKIIAQYRPALEELAHK